MGRPIATRFRVEGTLLAETPLHVGGAGEVVETDLPLASDGSGKPYLPGTSLAGALREWYRSAFSESFAADLWGYTPLRGQPSDRGFASLVLIEDAKIHSVARLELRDGVGIDRVEGRAADGIKYDRQILPSGTRLGFDMTVEVPFLPPKWIGDLKARIAAEKNSKRREVLENRLARLYAALDRNPDKVAAALGHMVRMLETDGARLGAAKTRGLGRVRLAAGYSILEEDLKTREGILDALKRQGNKLDVASLTARASAEFKPKSRPCLAIRIAWKPTGPMMVKADAAGIAIDMLPLVTAGSHGLAQVIPGSSIKGALRAHAERIAATVLGTPANYDSHGRTRFLEHVSRCAIVETLFGAARKPVQKDMQPGRNAGGGAWDDGLQPLPGLGALTVEDCIAEKSINRKIWQDILVAGGGGEEKSMKPLMDTLEGTAWAADGFLYSVLEPEGVAWPAIEMSVALDRLTDHRDMEFERERDESDEDWEARQKTRAENRAHTRHAAVVLLLLTLRDFARCRIPLGFGGNRGLGTVEVKSIAFSASETADTAFKELARHVLTPDSFDHPSDELCAAFQPLNKAWKEYPGLSPAKQAELHHA
jgi:CRISPR/Cas system CSM-associated protein Csm3 (group 7 of RAMP superfamily)